MADFYHSVRLDKDKCKGCTNCIKRCPTGAIRVRGGKARIVKERCIDCGECINVCPYHAKYAEYDLLEKIKDYEYSIALPAPALYGQFGNVEDVDIVLTALKRLGFDDVFEVAAGAELVSEETRKILERQNEARPLISSACPAVVRLIRISFPNLIDRVVSLNSPMEIAAAQARRLAAEKTGLPDEAIGVFFITPCPAKLTAIKEPICLGGSQINGAIAIKELYPKLLRAMKESEAVEPLKKSGLKGVGWASSGGEVEAQPSGNCLSADGIENVIKILNEVEDEKLGDIDFIELNACTGGCVGGSLNYENPYVAKARIKKLRQSLPESGFEAVEKPQNMYWHKSLEATDVLRLADNLQEAMKRMGEKEKLIEDLPGLDCGICGAPSCAALADDVVRGFASEKDCVFRFRQEVSAEYIPVPFRASAEERKEKKQNDS